MPGDPLLGLLTGCPVASRMRPAVLAGVETHRIDLHHQQRQLLELEGLAFRHQPQRQIPA
jgi:hypothetical protein